MEKHQKIRCQSIAKTEEGFATTNEDAVYYTSSYVAVADGAGGTGYFNAEWSKHLCEALPTAALCDYEAFEAWYEPLRTSFFEEQRARVAPHRQDRYDKIGSLSTLVAVWRLSENQLQILSYGDSGVFVFDKKGKLKFRNIERLVDYTESPYLLLSNAPPRQKALLISPLDIEVGDWVVLASDAISQWILMQYLLRDDPKGEVQEVLDSPYNLGNLLEKVEQNQTKDNFSVLLAMMYKCLETEDGFRHCCQTRYAADEMAMDDYTLLLWQIS